MISYMFKNKNKTLTKTNTTSVFEEKRDKMLRDRYLSKLRKAYNIESSSSSSYNS